MLDTNSIFLDSILFKDVPYTPIWLMRQAGRYLPEYRKLREKAGSFLNLCTNPDLATIVTLQPLKRFDLDAAILFSDILVIPMALGMELNFVENEGPQFAKPIENIDDIDALSQPDLLSNLSYVFDTIKNTKSELPINKALIGFSGSPFTLACYMLEGKSSPDYFKIKKMLYSEPESLHKLLALLTDSIIKYLNKQIESGVDAVMLFDSWGGILTTHAFEEFSLKYLNYIVRNLTKQMGNKKIPVIIFTKGGGLWLQKLASTNCDVLGIDWTVNIGSVKALIPNIALQGNLDPAILAIGDRSAIKFEATKILENYKEYNQGNLTGHIFNLGHGVNKITNPDDVAYLIDVVHNFNR